MKPQAIFSFLQNPAKVVEAKAELLNAIKPLQRGVTASPEDRLRIDKLVQGLEKQNPNKNSLAAPEINGKWELLYTTSDAILGSSKPPFLRPFGPIYQYIDAPNLKAANKESFPFFNQVYAELKAETKSRVGVQFKQFRIFGLIPITAPESAKGKLDTTFVDSTLRISRGDKGNLFVLIQRDPKGRP